MDLHTWDIYVNVTLVMPEKTAKKVKGRDGTVCRDSIPFFKLLYTAAQPEAMIV